MIKPLVVKQGFSLVELAVVLVILGLLVGSVLSGQSLIRAAELRSVTNELTNFTTAISSFQDKYMALPGDMPNATKFWGQQTTGCNTANSGGKTTCNGNGDGLIESSGPGLFVEEPYRAWQHLANAQLIAGTYSGCANCSGISNPQSKITNASWMIEEVGTLNYPADTIGNYFNGDYGRTLSLFNLHSASGMVLKPEELWNIDTKIDDGKPAQGKIVAIGAYDADPSLATCTDATDNTSLSASYLLNSNQIGCALAYRQ